MKMEKAASARFPLASGNRLGSICGMGNEWKTPGVSAAATRDRWGRLWLSTNPAPGLWGMCFCPWEVKIVNWTRCSKAQYCGLCLVIFAKPFQCWFHSENTLCRIVIYVYILYIKLNLQPFLLTSIEMITVLSVQGHRGLAVSALLDDCLATFNHI